MAVPPEVIEEIRNRVDIVRVIGDVVPLKKSGRNFSGLCPFHQEKTPSFTVSDQKQLYHCFGCGEGGTVFTFLMKFHRLTFPEVLERAATLAGISLEEYRKSSDELKKKKEAVRRAHHVLSYAREMYHRILLDSDSAKEVRRYAESRGLTSDIQKTLKLGFAPDAWNTLVTLLTRDKLSLEDAAAAGLIAKRPREDGYYDVFRGRLLFPIEDVEGNCVGFGGRVIGEGEPKYLNSPQTVVFDKGRMLYGIAGATVATRVEKKILVVEGYMDQVALRFAGFPNVLATMGTALTESHARALKKLTDQVVVVFDGDSAGLKAARRSMIPLLSQGLDVRVVLLPQGEDPDTYVRKIGAGNFKREIQEALPILSFFVDRFFKNESDMNKKAQAVSELADLVRTTENAFLREAILDEATRLTGLEKAVLRGEKKMTTPKLPAPKAKATPVAAGVPNELWVLLRLSAEVPEARNRFYDRETLGLISDSDWAETAKRWLGRLSEKSEVASTASRWVDEWDDLDTRAQLARAFLENWASQESNWQQIWDDCLKQIRRKEIHRLSEAVRLADETGDEFTVMELLKRMNELKRFDQGRMA